MNQSVILTRFTSVFVPGYENLDFSCHPFLRHIVNGRRGKLTSFLLTLFYTETLLRFTISTEKVIEMFLIIFMAISDLLNVLCAI